MDNILGEAILQFLFYNPSKVGVGIGEEQESTLSKKSLHLLEHVFPINMGSILKRICTQESQTGNRVRYFPL